MSQFILAFDQMSFGKSGVTIDFGHINDVESHCRKYLAGFVSDANSKEGHQI